MQGLFSPQPLGELGRSAQFLELCRYITLPSEIALIADQSKPVFYDVLFSTAIEILPSDVRPLGAEAVE